MTKIRMGRPEPLIKPDPKFVERLELSDDQLHILDFVGRNHRGNFYQLADCMYVPCGVLTRLLNTGTAQEYLKMTMLPADYKRLIARLRRLR